MTHFKVLAAYDCCVDVVSMWSLAHTVARVNVTEGVKFWTYPFQFFPKMGASQVDGSRCWEIENSKGRCVSDEDVYPGRNLPRRSTNAPQCT